MDRTTAPGAVGGLYVDEDVESEIQGTLLVAADRNAIQEELIALIVAAGLTPSAGTLTQVRDAVAARISQIMTAAEILTRIKTVDGAGSGLDADTLDGVNSATFARQDQIPVFAGGTTGNEGGEIQLQKPSAGTTLAGNIVIDVIGDKIRFYEAGGISRGFELTISSGDANAAGLVWTSTNDGAGSGLDADLLDGQDGSYYQNAGNLNAGTIPSGRLSASDLLALIKTVDGAGSGLDADLLDGVTSAALGDKRLTFNSNQAVSDFATSTPSLGGLEVINPDGVGKPAFIAFHRSGAYATYFGLGTDGLFYHGGWSAGATKYKIWSEASDGPGSGLDADLLDGKHATNFSSAEYSSTVGGGRTYTIGAMAVGETRAININMGNNTGGTVNMVLESPASGTYAIDLKIQVLTGGIIAVTGSVIHINGVNIAAGTLYTQSTTSGIYAQYSGTITRQS